MLGGIFLVNGQSGSGINTFGVACGLLSAAMYSVMVLANKRAVHIVGMENSNLQLFVSFLTVAVSVGIRNDGYSMLIASDEWIWIIILGLLNTRIGCYFYFSSIGNLPVQTVAVCRYLEPLSAVLFSVIVLGETMIPIQIFGAVLIIGGAVFGVCLRIKR